MSTIVSKFGGSSVADADCFRHVRDIISPRRHRQYIILSAPGKRTPDDDKITDLLVKAHNLYRDGRDAGAQLTIIRQRFTQIIRDLRLDIDPQQFLSTLERDVRHSADRAASRGEYLCAKIFAAYASLPFVDSHDLIHFDSDGRIMRDRIALSVCRMAERYPCAVIPGFYGSMPDGQIKTFTRGGSDITGALVAAALSADIYENWTDVDGLMSADPTVCPDALCHPAVSYRQMRMLARSGAKVLHPYCVEPVCEAGIPTVLKNTFAPEKPGTYISDHVRRRVPCICAYEGFSAVALNALSDEGRLIACGLNTEIYFDRFHEQILALKCDNDHCPGMRVVVISAFGLNAALRDTATRLISPIAELHTEHCSRYLVLQKDCVKAQTKLHALLASIFTESRIPSGCDEPYHPMP